ncbi:MAG: FAD-dependent oxidoreductase [Candidatus Carbobacillus altaicus]|nr:FAD-dependent oxidoreductase [Candidatus Carbobacillus altaicus]
MSQTYDIVFLGGGPAGYVGALFAQKLGLKVAIVDRDGLGGTCLHRGCIPSKSLLKSAEMYREHHRGRDFGVESEGVRFHWDVALKRAHEVIETLERGIQFLMKKGAIDVYSGHGRLLGPSIFAPQAGTISVIPAREAASGLSEGELISGTHVVLATGSRPRSLPGLTPDGRRIFDSDSLWKMETLPKSVVILGGGVIGVEWASLFHDLGVEVTVVEMTDRLLPGEDEEISRELMRLYKKKGIRLYLGYELDRERLHVTDHGVEVVLRPRRANTSDRNWHGEEGARTDREVASAHTDASGPLETTLTVEALIVSVGRVPNIEDIGLENTRIRTKDGAIVVNDTYQTDEAHIYAVGDVIGGLMLAHLASREAIEAVLHMTGKGGQRVDPKLVPKATYSYPEVASMGWTEQDARQAGYAVGVAKMPYRAIGKALIEGEHDGFLKLVYDRDSEDVLGVHIIGVRATELIGEASLARFMEMSPWELTRVIHPHPTLSELLGEAAFIAEGTGVHSGA